MSDFSKVAAFHHKFGLTSVTHEGAGPREVSSELMLFRFRFLCEELREIAEAMGIELKIEELTQPNGSIDHEKLADGLIDLNYVSHGTAHVFGYPWPELFDEVQRANMTKERATHADQSLRKSTFDVIKPAGWRGPDIKGVLRRHGWPF